MAKLTPQQIITSSAPSSSAITTPSGLNGLIFSKDTLQFSNTQTTLERYYNILTNNKLLTSHAHEERYKKLIEQVKGEFTQ